MRRVLFCFVCLFLGLTPALYAEPSQAHQDLVDSIARNLCDKKVVLLGEASHGDGATIAFAITQDTFLDTQQLKQFGNISSRPFNYEWHKEKWDQVFDGMLVFREEHPPHFIEK